LAIPRHRFGLPAHKLTTAVSARQHFPVSHCENRFTSPAQLPTWPIRSRRSRSRAAT